MMRKSFRGKKSSKKGAAESAKIISVEYLDGDKEMVDSFIRGGKVKAKYSNGDVYEGIVENSGSRGYVKAKRGVYTWASQAYYDGEYVDDQKQGQGKYVTASGDVFTGTFMNGTKEGPGKYEFASGDKFTGTWKKGARHGKGTYEYANGKVEVADWKDGKMIASSKVTKVAPIKVDGPSLIIAGPPASGKGTQCKNLREELGVIHLSTGDMLRAAASAGTDVGKKAKAYMDKGLLVPDEVIISIIEERLNEPDVKEQGFLLDGFPRTQAQAASLSKMGVEVDKFILLQVPDEVLVERVEGRRIDPETGNSYHVKFNPPPPELESRLKQRDDDTAEKVKVRLEAYHGNIKEVRKHYEEQVAEIDGNVHPAEVWTQIRDVIADIEQTTHQPIGIVISGAPASGKGTQCEYIKEKHGVIHLSTGDMLRAAVKNGTPAGKKAKAYMDKGELVPDEVVIGVVQERLQEPDVKEKGFLLDGFPRTFGQAQALEKMGVTVDLFLLLNVPDNKLVERVTGRRIDPVTKKTYHIEFNPPPPEIVERLETRSDDTEEKVKTRLEAYHGNLAAIKEHFNDQLHEVDGDAHKEHVWSQVDEAVSKKKEELSK